MNRLFLPALLVLASVSVSAAEPAAKSDPRAVIAAKFPELRIEDVRPSKIPGIYEIRVGADSAYVSADGKYVITGDMYEIDTRINITEQARMQERRAVLAKLDERDMIIFGPASAPQHTITVFTDVDCGYCRKLHSEIDQLTKLGVRVRYMAYPRSGPDSPDWRKMEAVWCSNDRKSAITRAKRGEDVKAPSCTTPVAKQFELGEQLGVRGTPAIFTTNGDYIGGYLPPGKLKQELDELRAAAK
ncbi:MAG: DsbC family protein [Xanthomonadaceae bacterium]|nr:DsbC family protein [Xanthomonadaceae bacterium]